MLAPGFFNSGVTWSALNMSENFPSANERFASLVISGPKTSAQLLMIVVGTKSIGYVFAWVRRITKMTSASLTFSNLSNRFGVP